MIHYWYSALLALSLHHVAAMSFIPFGKWKGAASLQENGRDAPKNKGEIPHLSNSKSFRKKKIRDIHSH